MRGRLSWVQRGGDHGSGREESGTGRERRRPARRLPRQVRSIGRPARARSARRGAPALPDGARADLRQLSILGHRLQLDRAAVGLSVLARGLAQRRGAVVLLRRRSARSAGHPSRRRQAESVRAARVSRDALRAGGRRSDGGGRGAGAYAAAGGEARAQHREVDLGEAAPAALRLSREVPTAMEVLAAIGNTSLVRLRSLVPAGSAEVWVKLEWENPTGS